MFNKKTQLIMGLYFKETFEQVNGDGYLYEYDFI